MALFVTTLQSLLTGRRLVPILVVCTLALGVQGWFTRNASAVGIAALLCVCFVMVAPVAYRALLPSRRQKLSTWAGLALYGVVGVVCVGTCGWVVPEALHVGPTFLTDGGSLVIATGLFWAGGWGLGRDIDMEVDLLAERGRADSLKREAERTELLALRSHLDPHFLFNTLNAIAEWCREDGEVAERATLELAAMLRTILRGVKSEAWPLADEIALVNQLCALYAMRDPSMLQVSWNTEGPIERAEIPPMLLLQLVENAIKHGPWSGHRGALGLSARVNDDSMELIVRNPGPFRPQKEGEGLPTLRKRIDLAYGSLASFRIQSDGNSTVAELSVPRTVTLGAET